MNKIKIPKRNYAFIDGSFNPQTNVYGYGGFLVDRHGKKHILQGSGDNPKMAAMRNVAGELLGAKEVIRTALAFGMKKLTLFYDYEGIAKWATGEWKCHKPATKSYAKFVSMAGLLGLKLYFQHVKAHAGILENEEADRLAREAVGL